MVWDMLNMYPLLRKRSHLRMAVRSILLSSVLCLGMAPHPSRATNPDPVELDIPISVGGFGLQFFQEAAEAYSQQTSNMAVNLYGDPRVGDKVRIRIIEGKYPSASNAWGVPWYNLIQSGKVLDLAPYLDGPNWEGDASWRSSFLPGSLDRWSEGHSTWAVPFAYSVYAIFYNKALFREHGWPIPTTWDDLFTLCETIESEGLAPFAFPGVYMSYADWMLKAAYYNLAGPDEYQRYQRIEPGTRSSDAFKRAAGVVQHIAQNHFQPGWQGMSHTSAQLQFFEGHAAMMANGTWLVGEMEGKIPDDFDLGTFNFPVFPDGKGSPQAIQVGSGYYFLFADNPHLKETVDFFRFLTSREQAARFSALRDTPTAVRGVANTSFSPFMQDVADMIQQSTAAYGSPPGSSAAFPGMAQAFNDARFNLLNGSCTPEAFGDALEAAATRSREAAATSNAVVYRHVWKGTGLLLLMAFIVLYTALTQWRKRRQPRTGSEPTATLSPGNLLLFLGPALVMYLVFTIKPCLESFAWAFTEWDGISDRKSVGLLHFKRLLFDSDVFWKALGNNLFIMFVPTAFVVPLALCFSFLISRGIWGSNLFRICFFFPNILGGIAVTLLWMNAYDPQGGLVNGALTRLGFASFENFAWLSQDYLYWSLIPMAIWGACGFNMILYLAGMESVDNDLYEASSMDGATTWQQFVHITIPMIWEILIISTVFMVIGGLKAFEVIWLLTSQQPTSNTHVIGTWMVTTMFQDFKVGQATAIAVVLFILVFFGTLATMRVMKREAVQI